MSLSTRNPCGAGNDCLERTPQPAGRAAELLLCFCGVQARTATRQAGGSREVLTRRLWQKLFHAPADPIPKLLISMIIPDNSGRFGAVNAQKETKQTKMKALFVAFVSFCNKSWGRSPPFPSRRVEYGGSHS
jgi:hypothetical protein